jgi:two-component system, response regulator YesN
MHDSFAPARASRAPHASRASSFLWVDLTRQAGAALGQTLGCAFDLRRVTEPAQIPAAIQIYAPQFLCFEFDQPGAPGLAALMHTRHTHPGLPVLMITDCLSEAVALWALRIRLWDLLVKPVSAGTLRQHIAALAELTRQQQPVPAAARAILFPPQGDQLLADLQGLVRQARTQAAIAHVAAHFAGKIALDQAAALCRLSQSQFCRAFRQEHGISFAQYLLHYRIERACERLDHPGALAKEAAYSVGFNDLSYFTRAFKRQVGVCPSEYQYQYQAGAGLS